MVLWYHGSAVQSDTMVLRYHVIEAPGPMVPFYHLIPWRCVTMVLWNQGRWCYCIILYHGIAVPWTTSKLAPLRFKNSNQLCTAPGNAQLHRSLICANVVSRSIEGVDGRIEMIGILKATESSSSSSSLLEGASIERATTYRTKGKLVRATLFLLFVEIIWCQFVAGTKIITC